MAKDTPLGLFTLLPWGTVKAAPLVAWDAASASTRMALLKMGMSKFFHRIQWYGWEDGLSLGWVGYCRCRYAKVFLEHQVFPQV